MLCLYLNDELVFASEFMWVFAIYFPSFLLFDFAIANNAHVSRRSAEASTHMTTMIQTGISSVVVEGGHSSCTCSVVGFIGDTVVVVVVDVVSRPTSPPSHPGTLLMFV